MAKRVTEDDIAKWKELAEKGYPATQISKETGWSADTIRKYLRGGDGSKPKKKKAKKEAVIEETEEDEEEDEEESESVFDGTYVDIGDMVAEVMDEIGDFKEKRIKFAANTIRQTPQYQTMEGMFNFLSGIGVKAQPAKIIVERVFGAQSMLNSNQFGNPMHQMGNPVNQLMRPQQQMFQQPMGFSYPQTPFSQQQQPMMQIMTPSGPQYVPLPQYYPPQPTKEKKGVTEREVESRVESAVRDALDKKSKDDNIEKQFGEIREVLSNLIGKLKEGDNSTSYTQEEIPIVLDDGTIAKDPESGEILYRKRKVAGAPQQKDGNMELVIGMMNKMIEMQKAKPESDTTSEIIKEMQNMRNNFTESLHSKDMQMMAKNFEFIQDSQERQVSELAKAISQMNRNTNGMSEDGKVMVTKIDRQADLLGQQLKNLNTTVGQGLGIVGNVLSQSNDNAPKTENIRQWNDEEVEEINKRLTGDDEEED